MEQKIYSSEEIKERLAPVFKKYDVQRAILFGSYGKGTATLKSDVDLLVDSGLKGLRFVGLIEDVREALDEKKIDLFDVTHIDAGSQVDREIKMTGVQIYEK